jgi:hypothetical protein
MGEEVVSTQSGEARKPKGEANSPLNPKMPFFLLMAMSSTVAIIVVGTLPFKLNLFSLPWRTEND